MLVCSNGHIVLGIVTYDLFGNRPVESYEDTWITLFISAINLVYLWSVSCKPSSPFYRLSDANRIEFLKKTLQFCCRANCYLSCWESARSKLQHSFIIYKLNNYKIVFSSGQWGINEVLLLDVCILMFSKPHNYRRKYRNKNLPNTQTRNTNVHLRWHSWRTNCMRVLQFENMPKYIQLLHLTWQTVIGVSFCKQLETLFGKAIQEMITQSVLYLHHQMYDSWYRWNTTYIMWEIIRQTSHSHCCYCCDS